RRRVGTSHNLEAGAHGMREAARVEGVDSLQVCANLLRHPLLALRGAIRKLRSKSGSRASVDAKRGCALRRQAKKGVSQPVEQRERVGLVCCGRRRRTITCAPG